MKRPTLREQVAHWLAAADYAERLARDPSACAVIGFNPSAVLGMAQTYRRCASNPRPFSYLFGVGK